MDVPVVLRDAECGPNWNFDIGKMKRLIPRFQSYLTGEDKSIQKWSVRVCLAQAYYQAGRLPQAFEEINQAVIDLENAEDYVSQKYIVSGRHIVNATKAWMFFRGVQSGNGRVDLPSLDESVRTIPLIENMSDLEKAGLYGLKSNILRLYGGEEAKNERIELLKLAVGLDPGEFEWKLSLVGLYTRDRRYFRRRNKSRMTARFSDSQLKESMDLIEDLTNHPDHPNYTALLYYKAVTLGDAIWHRQPTSDVVAKRQKIDDLWRRILESSPDHPTYIEFGAEWLLHDLQNDRNLEFILPIILNGFENHPEDRHFRAAARFVSTLPDDVRSSSATAQRIVELLS